MIKRMLTILVELDENNKPSWIWDSHMNGEFINGVNVICIGEGDQFKEIEDDDENDFEEHEDDQRVLWEEQ